ncbi:MAG: hypothetical protein QNJ85_10040 [Gammaproteobacteria bacterium]|nr:hypothetical protein [Gammaproteobacteria bacterium]
MEPGLESLLSAVQRNCHISDARHAGDYTLCVYLLKMREYYRWEKGYRFDDSVCQSDVGDWLRERESLWERIEDEPFEDLPLDGLCYDPFDDRAMNAALNPHGLVYSGGLGQQSTPHFFLGKLLRRETRADFTVLISETEYARDLTAPPAMTRDGTIYIRRESLRRMIWERFEEWRWNRLDNAMGRALGNFDFDRDAGAALEAMTDAMLESVLLHEKGEVLAGQQLGPEWEQMLAAMPRSKTAFLLRAVRDHLADSQSTLPGLLAADDDAPLHFFFANLTHLRKHLFPALATAFDDWTASGRRAALEELLPSSTAHWQALAQQVLEVYRRDPASSAAAIGELIENSKL